VDYYFEINIGYLLAIKLKIYRYDFSTSNPLNIKNKETLYIYRTLASINNVNILDYKPSESFEYTVIIIILLTLTIAITTIIIIYLKKNKLNIKRVENDIKN